MTAATLQNALRTLRASADDTRTAVSVVAGEVDALLGERLMIAQTLADFYRAPLSMSSVQPILELAERLNPSLRDRP
jgi:hypothetical protein